MSKMTKRIEGSFGRVISSGLRVSTLKAVSVRLDDVPPSGGEGDPPPDEMVGASIGRLTRR